MNPTWAAFAVPPAVRVGLCLCLGLSAPALRADEPLEPPANRKIVAPSGTCWAVSDAQTRMTTAYLREGRQARRLWSIDGWYRVAALASDCRHFVTGFEGVNLLPPEAGTDTELLRFHRDGRLIRAVTLGELVRDRSQLKRTASHLKWGHYVGVERGVYYRVSTVDRGDLLFDMRTGRIVETPR